MSVRMLMLGGALWLLACAAPIRALPASLDPSNPDGPEGATPPASTSVSDESAPVPPNPNPAPMKHDGHGGHLHHMHAAPGSKP